MARRLLTALSVSVCVLTSGCGRNAVGAPVRAPFGTPSATLAPEPSPTLRPRLAFDISGQNHYEDSVGSLRFLLEVRNVNDFDVEGAKATVILKDAEGRTVDSRSGYSRLDVLRAGNATPIVVVFFLGAKEFSSYEVEVEGQEAGYLAGLLHQDLQVVEEWGRVGEWVPYEVLGHVENSGDRDAESVTLVVACRDADGKMVAVGSGRPEQRTILAGNSADFLISLDSIAGEIASCQVQVEGLVAPYTE